MTFTNASFEIAGASPGEAEDWTWTNVTTHDEFPTFYAGVPAYSGSRETFDAGWRQYPTWVYADAAARTAAVGFGADDVGSVALQESDYTLWALQSEIGPTWQLISTLPNETPDWPPTARPLFRGSLTGREDFERWMSTGRTVADVPVFVTVDDDGVLALGIAAAAGMRGWVDGTMGTVTALRSAETFDEGWGADPWTGVAMRFILRSDALSWPVTIRPERARLWWWSLAQDRVQVMTIIPGQYENAADLASALNAGWAGAGLPLATFWRAWNDDTDEGVELYWDEDYGGADLIVPAWPPGLINSDARPSIGIPTRQQAIIPASRISDLPSAFSSDKLYVDGAYFIAARTAVSADGGLRVLPPTAMPASIDGGDREDFDFGPWTGGAVWRTNLDLSSMTVPVWTDGGNYEGFDDPAVNWPDYYEV